MTSKSGTGEKRLRPESQTLGDTSVGSESARHKRLRLGSRSSSPSAPNHVVATLSVSDTYVKCAEREEGKVYQPRECPQQLPPFLGSAIHTGDDNTTVITGIRAMNVALGLRRLPAGFYAVVRHGGLEWRTENKSLSADNGAVEWNGPIPIPLDPSAVVCLKVYAPFELEPTLGTGEQLRELTATVKELSDHSATDVSFAFFPREGDTVSPCSSILVTIQRRGCENDDSSRTWSRVLGPYCSTSESSNELEDATNRGHSSLSHYRKYGGKDELERSVEEFERAFNICPLDHPCFAATRSNLAMAKFILCQVENADTSFEVPLDLYRSALATRPVGHVDRSSTMIHLAAVYFASFERQGDEVKIAKAEALLREVIMLTDEGSHESRTAIFMLQMHAGRRMDSGQLDGGLCMQGLQATPAEELLRRFKRFKDLNSLQQAIAILQDLAQSTPVSDDRYGARLTSLGVALSYRFEYLGKPCDLEDAISSQRDAVDFIPRSHPDRPTCLINLSNSLVARFEDLGELRDLEDAVSILKQAVDLTPRDHSERHAYLSILGSALKRRFERSLELGDLENAIASHNEAVSLTPHDHPEKPAHLDSLGDCYLTRFEHVGELCDLEDAVLFLKRAVSLTPHGDPNRPDHLTNFGTACLCRFERLGELYDIEGSILSHTNAIELSPDNDPDQPGRFSNLGNSYHARFEHLGELKDLDDSISSHRKAVELIPHDDPQKPVCLNNLGNACLTRFEHLGELSDLDDGISNHKQAVILTPPDHHDKAARLSNLSCSLLTRFEKLGELCDLEGAVSSSLEAVDRTPHGHPDKHAYLGNLGGAFSARFKRRGDQNDLEGAISNHRKAVDLIPRDHPDMPSHLINLARSFATRFGHLWEPGDIEGAISNLREAIQCTPQDHPDRHARLNDLGNLLVARFRHFGEPSDLHAAVSMLKDAIDLTSCGQSEKPKYLSDLGCALEARFGRFGDTSDIEGAISSQREAVDLTPIGHPDRRSHFDNLGKSYESRFEYHGDQNDLEDAISNYKEAVDLTPQDHPDKLLYLGNLGRALITRFQNHGELSELEAATSMLRDAANLTPDGHPNKPSHVGDLGSFFRVRYEHTGEFNDLKEAVLYHKEAVNLTAHDHPAKRDHLNNLGNSLRARFEYLGEFHDLEDAISSHRGAAELTPHDHPDNPGHLSDLGTSYLVRFERFGDLGDLEDAVSSHRNAVDLCPRTHPQKSCYLNNLGNSCLCRFERFGDLSDIEDAISSHKDAVSLLPIHHPNRQAFLHNLGLSFETRFNHFGELQDLEAAILSSREAMDLTPRDHPEKCARLTSLGISCLTRFELLGELSDLQEAISHHREAVHLVSHGHLDRPTCLNNLGYSYMVRFKRFRELRDIEDSISTHREAVDLTPDDHPDKSMRLSNFGDSLTTRFEHVGKLSDLEQAILAYSSAASVSTGSVAVRFGASQKWLSCARRIRHHSLLGAHAAAINLLPQLAWIGLSLSHRYSELAQGDNVAREAAATALDSGLLETAVEWLEQGRSIVWGELLQLRDSFDKLSTVHPVHASRLRELSAALEQAGNIREKSLSPLTERAHGAPRRARGSFQQEAHRYRTLAIERDKLLQEIRGLPGFERFLLHKEFSQLRASAKFGPVVILNAAESRCDALIIRADVDQVTQVPLPNFSFDRSALGLQKMLEKLLNRARGMPSDEREGRTATLHGISWEFLLSALWTSVVKPVLDALGISTSGNPSRIFWCPTGPFTFLPIHAAGLYGTQYSQPGHKVSDFVISSYIPALSILTLSPTSSIDAHSDSLCLLAVRQPHSDGLRRLPGVGAELEHIREVIQTSPSVHATLVESSVGTVEEVLALMKESDWVHFACHGIQDTERPVDSGLCLADGHRLKISDIIALSRTRGGLAFLSACQTAMGAEDLSDEAIHIAAGMLFAGYEGVVGTMWSISDRLAPRVARDVYGQLFRSGPRPDCREAARALHEAVQRLREGNVSFVEWLPFIHVGL